ncbi:MAG: hypothetical protein AAGD25_10245 [Cyanobacteria bacterium P01_F01_bin.150]
MVRFWNLVLFSFLMLVNLQGPGMAQSQVNSYAGPSGEGVTQTIDLDIDLTTIIVTAIGLSFAYGMAKSFQGKN